MPWLRIAALVIIGAVLFHVIDLEGVALGLSKIDAATFVSVIALFGGGQVLSAARWRLALSRMVAKPPAVLPLLRLYLIGMFCNLAMPTMAIGDAVRAELSRRWVGERGTAYAAVFVDRLIGVFAVLLVASIGVVLASPLLGDLVLRLLAIAFSACLVVFVLVAVAVRLHKRDRLPGLLVTFAEALATISRYPKTLSLSLAIAAVVQTVGVIVPIGLLSQAMSLDVPFLLHFLIVPATVLATLVPLTPNGIGLRESAFVVFYGMVSVDADSAFALGFAWSMVLVFFGLIGGLLVALNGGRIIPGFRLSSFRNLAGPVATRSRDR